MECIYIKPIWENDNVKIYEYPNHYQIVTNDDVYHYSKGSNEYICSMDSMKYRILQLIPAEVLEKLDIKIVVNV